MGTQEKKLPRSTQLSAVQLLCEKLFKVKVSDQKLFLKTKGDPVPQPLEQETVGGLTLDELGFQVRRVAARTHTHTRTCAHTRTHTRPRAHAHTHMHTPLSACTDMHKRMLLVAVP